MNDAGTTSTIPLQEMEVEEEPSTESKVGYCGPVANEQRRENHLLLSLSREDRLIERRYDDVLSRDLGDSEASQQILFGATLPFGNRIYDLVSSKYCLFP